MFKQIVASILLVALCVVFAQASSLLGSKDILGNYYDPYTGQYSSSLTGQVYNTVPQVAVAAPILRAPAVVAAPALAAPAVAAAPIWLRR